MIKGITIKDISAAAFFTIVVFVAHHYSGFLEQKVVAGEVFAWGWLFLWYTLFLLIGIILLRKWRGN